MIQQLEIDEFLKQSAGHLVLDVRSEGEFNYGHIPGATSLPLFNNEERKVVGTIYKQEGKDNAVLKGLDIVGPKMSGFIRFVKDSTSDKKIFVHCWRGGMRSGSMAWLFSNYGYEVGLLKGGYKSYRHYVLGKIAASHKLIVLSGRTGSGKTEVLQQLKEQGEQVIDLEKLANHKGSAFGALGQEPQPSTEHFENMLVNDLATFDINKRIWVEDESKSIGRVFLDLNLWQQMCAAPLFMIELPLAVRLKRLVNDYGENHTAGLEQSLKNIVRRLGNEQWKQAVDALHEKRFEDVARITLNYYDKAYDNSVSLKPGREITRFSFETDDTKYMAQELIKAANKKYGN